MDKKTVELEQRQGILWFAVYSYAADGNRTLLDYFPSFDLASQRFPEARLNGMSYPDPLSSQNPSKSSS
jgi:hypothetical protein